MPICNIIAKLNIIDRKIINLVESEVQEYKIRHSTIDIIRKYVTLSGLYISAASKHDTKEMNYYLDRLYEVAELMTPERVKELPPNVKKDLHTNNKNLKEITKKFLHEE